MCRIKYEEWEGEEVKEKVIHSIEGIWRIKFPTHLSIYNKMFWSIHIAELNGISHTGHSEAKTLGQGCLGDLFPWELLDLTLQFILWGEGQLSE